jgi:hypothetical protein
VTTYRMHNTYGTNNLRCAGMEERPKIKVTEASVALFTYDASPCPICMPFMVADRTVVVERREV